MPIRMRFMPQRGLLVSVAHGRLTMDDLLHHRQRVAESTHYHPGLHLLFDTRRTSAIGVSGDAVRTFAGFGQPGQRRFARMALLVGSDLHYGISRIFQAYAGQHDESTLRIIRDPGEAWRWINER
ncbi:MAG: hypothetical protein CMD39_08145 [Gammaproteobacteria bacterium]|nr:hypothetical protein [Gammaproteobacteria bacterium]